MIRENNDKFGGFNPYTPPDFTIDENRYIKYDETGAIKALAYVETAEQKREKLTFQKAKKFIIAFLVFCALMECYYFSTTFRPWKWKYKAWRPLIVRSLTNGSSADFAESQYSQKLQIDAQSDIDVLTEQYHVEKRSQFREVARKNDILFMTKDEVRNIFGEPSGEQIEDVFDEVTGVNACSGQEYYHAYSNRYIVVYYCSDICIGVGYIDK